MADNSDHKKPRNDINKLLPDVYQSDFNKGFFENTVNRHLTKNDSKHISGFIGAKNPSAEVDRNIKEETPHRQAFQLQPSMYSKIGNKERAYSFKSFLKNLSLAGVDIDKIQDWGSTLQFNWVPPVNIDKLINFSSYFWDAENRVDKPQYLTIENKCRIVEGKVLSYTALLNQFGETHDLQEVLFLENKFSIEGNLVDIFKENFVFYTRDTTNINLASKFWTVVSSEFDSVNNRTLILVAEDIALQGDTPPTTTIIGRWWVKESTGQLFSWDGSAWVVASFPLEGIISLTELRDVFQAEANCACLGDHGWDIKLWDDGQIGSLIWNDGLVSSISSTMAPPSPNALDLWYDTVNDVLNQRDITNTTWVGVVSNFSAILNQTTGTGRWDLSLECLVEADNQWIRENKWIHKTEVQSFAALKRARLPILEYNSTAELNEWTKTTYFWKYRQLDGDPFVSVDEKPHRFELEPIKGYSATFDGTAWFITLQSNDSDMYRDIDYTKTFVPGFQFKIIDDLFFSEVHTVVSSTYQEIPNGGNPTFVTIVKIASPTFTAPLVNDPVNNTRIVPVKTSKGDTWRGYSVHWVLDESKTTHEPIGSQCLNPYTLSNDDFDTPVSLPTGIEIIRRTNQEKTLSVGTESTIMFHPDFVYSPTQQNFYVPENSENLCVYINDVRQYGNYTEIVEEVFPNYTEVGSGLLTNVPIRQVVGITFFNPIKLLDVVRIEFGSRSLEGMGDVVVPVRTIEDETLFQQGVVAGTQPVYRSITNFHKKEQVKTKTNQYPLFNIYDVCTNEVIDASRIFAFSEAPDCPINVDIEKRIVVSTDGKDYKFVQNLLPEDNGVLYGYRNFANVNERFWFNPFTQKLMYWDGFAWCDRFLSDVTTSRTYVVPYISETEPADFSSTDGALWYDLKNNKLFQNDNFIITEITDLVIQQTDPTLQTVWQHGDINTLYVPEYVDECKQPITVGDPKGDWEVIDQWFFNPEHNNIKEVTFSEVSSHFNSIGEAQPPVPGFLRGGINTLTQNSFDYGLGGRIKEHNESMDTLISAMQVNNVNPVGLIEFIEDQYNYLNQLVKSNFERDAVGFFANTSKESINDRQKLISDTVITNFESNEFITTVYANTSAYNPDTGKGIKNWLATPAMFGLADKVKPHISKTDKGVYLLHHDGHRSLIGFDLNEEDTFATALIDLDDPRIPNAKMGVQSVNPPPSTVTNFGTEFGGTPFRTGVYWYQLGSGVQQLFRLELIEITPFIPLLTLQNGEPLKDGTRYYNTLSNTLFIKSGNAWVSEAVGNFAPAWKEVSLTDTLAEIYLEIETRLFDVTPIKPVDAFDFDILTNTPERLECFNAAYRTRFDMFVKEHSIKFPLQNVDYSSADAFTWNYTDSIVTTPPTTAVPSVVAASWQSLYTGWYGTPFPHLEPWVLQGYTDKPDWWDDEYKDTTGTRRWQYTHSTTTGMWENIRLGIIPTTRLAPNGDQGTGLAGQVTQYNYMSVNISDVTITGGFEPDDVLPPHYSTTDPVVRSIFTNFGTEIIAPNADYQFGMGSPAEWQWKTSTEHVFDRLIIAFQLQPARFMHSAYGNVYTNVDHLQVDNRLCKVFSHKDTIFHGDIINTNEVYEAKGLNQWYTNFNIFNGYDNNTEFRALWVSWMPFLSYQFAGIVDEVTFEVLNNRLDIIDRDYNIVLSNEGVINDYWVDGFNVKLISIAPENPVLNNQHDWKLELDTIVKQRHTITYYGVKQYQFTVDLNTDIATIFRYNIVNVDTATNRIYVSNDVTDTLTEGVLIDLTDNTPATNPFTIESSLYEPFNDLTRITLVEPLSNSVTYLTLDIQNAMMPWQTGDAVYLSSTQELPEPLSPDVAYYVIRINDTQMQLAETFADANNNVAIDFINNGTGVLKVGEIISNYQVFGGASHSQELWYHYAIDRNDIRTFTPPKSISGIQTLLNIFDGYEAYMRDQGVIFNPSEIGEIDPLTGRAIGWQFESERFIDWAFSIRKTSLILNDKYEIVPSVLNDDFTFVDMIPSWQPGQAVEVFSTNTLPVPLFANTTYYYVPSPTEPNKFQLSLTRNSNLTGSVIDLLTTGSGSLFISVKTARTQFPTFEVNPTAKHIVVDTPLGVVADLNRGNTDDVRIGRSLFDQFGDPLDSDKYNILREDKENKISIRENQFTKEVRSPLEVIEDRDFLHFGGAHLFFEGYEHVLLFNNYTVEDLLLYDPFLGLHVAKFELDYFEKADFTLRPTLGGHYLLDGKFRPNLEHAVDSLRNLYDVNVVPEKTDITKRGREILGFRGNFDFLDALNANTKTQFLFYRGMIQAKGSVNSVNAYTNSKQFVEAKVDEFWAYKVAEFGDSREKLFPEVKLLLNDSTNQDIRLEFLDVNEPENTPAVDASKELGFKIISFSDETRWKNFPQQKREIVSPIFLDANFGSMTKLFVSDFAPFSGDENLIDFWYNKTTQTLSEWDGSNWIPVVGKTNDNGSNVFFKLDERFDDVRIVHRTLTASNDITKFNTSTLSESATTYEVVNSEIIKFNKTNMVDIYLIFAITPSAKTLNVAKIIDDDASTIVQNLELFDPARGNYYHLAKHNIDLFLDEDPAKYNEPQNPNDISTQPWNARETGTRWLDTSSIEYLPYYDKKIFPNINDRLYKWGKLTEWSDVKIYEWVSTIVKPEDWDGEVLAQANDITIKQNDKLTGTPKRTIFKRTRTPVDVDPTLGINGIDINLPGHNFNVDDFVLFTSDGDFPSYGTDLVLEEGVQYVVVDSLPNIIRISDTFGGAPFNFTPIVPTVPGEMKCVPLFDEFSWKKQPIIRERFYSAMDNSIQGLEPTFNLTGDFEEDDKVELYINGNKILSDITLDSSLSVVTTGSGITLTEKDIVDIVRPRKQLLPEDLIFDPANDDGRIFVDWIEEFENTIVVPSIDSTDPITYHFWVEQSQNRDLSKNDNISVLQTKTVFTEMPEPYIVLQNPVDTTTANFGYQFEPAYTTPVNYRQVILRNASDLIFEDNRFILRFTKDLSLRNTIETNFREINRKNKHEEWRLFRKNQTENISKGLWDKMVESLSGFKLSDTTVRVPSLDMELYDAANNTSTRFGLDDGQTFVDKTIGLKSLIGYLTDPNNDFSPIDIRDFLIRHPLDTPEDIRAALDEIFTRFSSEHVNAIWFEMLNDALVNKKEYKDILKTSWLSLHGIILLDINGRFS